MRKIKFRVWTGSRMEYDIVAGRFGHFYVNPGVKGDGLDEKDSASLSPFNTIYSDRCPLMQFTGIQDVNGFGIYEGDIVLAASAGHWRNLEVRWRQEGSPGWILYPSWRYGKWWHLHGSKNNDGTYFDHVEIIGNIYEHPELLEKKQ